MRDAQERYQNVHSVNESSTSRRRDRLGLIGVPNTTVAPALMNSTTKRKDFIVNLNQLIQREITQSHQEELECSVCTVVSSDAFAFAFNIYINIYINLCF